MKAFVTFSAVVGLLALGSTCFATGTGMPGPGERVAEVARTRPDIESRGDAYALTGQAWTGPDCADQSSLTATQRERCDPRTSVAHRRYPGGAH